MGAVQRVRTTPSVDLSTDELWKHFGDVPVLRGVSVAAPAGAITALVGPSGCGKTTLLRTIAGLERPDAGVIRIGDQAMVGPGTFIAPERRRVGMVFQDWALFPHLSVERNVAFGLPRRERGGDRVRRALELVDLIGFEQRLPSQLSGGQQQRVALARALAPEPAVLLLDEPFSNLDAGLRAQVRIDVRDLLSGLGVTTIVVTHDQEEALSLGEKVVVMRNGVVVQAGSPASLYSNPADPWVAGFLGEANLLRSHISGTNAQTVLGPVPLLAAHVGAAEVLVRPEEVRLALGGDAVVCSVEYYGHDTAYQVALPSGDTIRVREVATPRFRSGDRVAAAYGGPATVAYPSGHAAG